MVGLSRAQLLVYFCSGVTCLDNFQNLTQLYYHDAFFHLERHCVLDVHHRPCTLKLKGMDVLQIA